MCLGTHVLLLKRGWLFNSGDVEGMPRICFGGKTSEEVFEKFIKV